MTITFYVSLAVSSSVKTGPEVHVLYIDILLNAINNFTRSQDVSSVRNFLQHYVHSTVMLIHISNQGQRCQPRVVPFPF